jgi:hypothetical protein
MSSNDLTITPEQRAALLASEAEVRDYSRACEAEEARARAERQGAVPPLSEANTDEEISAHLEVMSGVWAIPAPRPAETTAKLAEWVRTRLEKLREEGRGEDRMEGLIRRPGDPPRYPKKATRKAYDQAHKRAMDFGTIVPWLPEQLPFRSDRVRGLEEILDLFTRLHRSIHDESVPAPTQTNRNPGASGPTASDPIPSNKIPPDRRTRPLGVEQAARLLGYTGKAKAVRKRLRTAMDSGNMPYEKMTQQSYIFDLDRFPESVRSRL